jgi:hypothetical protein
VGIDSPSLAFVPKEFYAVDLFVVPMWGLYANMIAQLISQISSHFIVHYHRRIIRRATKVYEERHNPLLLDPKLTAENTHTEDELLSPASNDDIKDQLCKHAFSRPHRGESDKLVTRRYINFLLLFGSTLLCILLAVSCDIPSMKLETLGIVGLLIELGQNLQEAVRYEGVFSMAQVLVNQARFLGGFTNYIGLGSLASLFVLTVLVVPIMQIMTLVLQWFVPLAPTGRERVAIVLEILQAWQYVEVYILAIIIESWYVLQQIHGLSYLYFCAQSIVVFVRILSLFTGNLGRSPS